MKNYIVIAFVFMLGLLGCKAQTNDLPPIQVVQQLLVEQMVETVQDRTVAIAARAAAVDRFADALLKVQRAETNRVYLTNLRDQASQLMTISAFEKAVEEAKALGVSGTKIKNISVLWHTAETVGESDLAITQLRAESAKEILRTGDMGRFRRSMPTWLGGPSSLAVQLAPAPVEGTNLLARLARLEGAVAAWGSPTK